MVAAVSFYGAPDGHGRRPKIIRQLQDRLSDFYDNPDVLPSLARANGRKRTMYEQRRWACVTVLQTLLHYTDVLTLRVGCRGADVLGVKLATIAEQQGIGDRRLDRVIRDLRAAGILRSFERSEIRNGKRIGHAACRVILRDLWTAFGLDVDLAKARQGRSQSLPKTAGKMTRRARGRGALALSSILAGIPPPHR